MNTSPRPTPAFPGPFNLIWRSDSKSSRERWVSEWEGELILSPGQSAVGPPGIPHKWWNLTDEEEVHMLVEIRPALNVETLLETWVGLARDGKTIWGIPKNPLQFAVLAHEVGGWFYPTGALMPVWNACFVLLAPLAFVGRLLEYRV